jgi:hypothetical protein
VRVLILARAPASLTREEARAILGRRHGEAIEITALVPLARQVVDSAARRAAWPSEVAS